MLEVKLKKFNDNNQFFNESFKESKPFGDFVAILNEEKELNIFYYKEIIETSNNFHQLVPIPESKIPDITSYFWGRIHETMIILLALDKNYIVHLYRIILPKAKINLSNSEIFEIHEIKTEYSRKTARKGLIHFFEEDPQKITNQNQSESAQIHVFKTQIQPDYLHQALGKPTTNPYERDLKSLAIVDLISAKNQSLNTLLILSSNVAVICKITENHFYGVEMFILSGEKNKIIPFVQFRRKQDFLYALCEKGKSIHIWDISHAQKVAILKISKIAFFKKIKFKIEKNCIQFDVTQNNSKLVICYSNRFLFVLDLDEYFFNYQNQLGISLIKPQKFPYVFQDPKDQVFDLYQHLHKKFVPPNDAFCSLDSYLFDKDDPNQDPELEISKQKFDSDIHQEWLIGKHVYEQKVCGMFVEMRKMRSAFVFHWPHLIENRDCSSEFQPSWSSKLRGFPITHQSCFRKTDTHQDPSLRSGQHLQYHHENKICTILALINNSITIISPKKFHHVSKKKPKLFLGKFLLLNSQVLLCYSDKNPVSVTDRRDLCSSAFLLNLDHLNQQKFPISSISFNEPTFIYGELNKNFFSVISRSGINAVVLGFTESQIKKNIAMFHSNQSTQFIAKINNWVLGSYDDTLLENALTKQDFQSIDEMIQSQKTQEQIIKFLTQMFALLQEKQLATFDPNFLEDVFVKSRARLVEIIRNIVSESNENLENNSNQNVLHSVQNLLVTVQKMSEKIKGRPLIIDAMFQLEKNPKIEKINQDSQQFNSEQDEPSKPKSIDEIVTELTQELVDSNISSSISIISSNPSFLQNNIFLNLKEDYQLKMTAKDLNLEISLFSFLKIFASKIAYIFFRHGDSKTALKILGGFGSTHKTKFLNTILSNTVIKKIRNQILLLQNDQQIQEIKTPLELIKSIENLQNSLIHVTDDYSKVYSSQLRKVKNTLRESLQFEKFSNAISQTIITQKDVFEFWKDFDPLIQEEEYYAGDIFPRNLNEKSLFPHIDRIIFPKKSTEKIESKTNKFSRLYFAAKPLWIKHCLSPRNRFKIFLDIKQNFSKQFGDQIFPIEDESKNYNDFVYEKLFYHLSHSQFEPILELLKNIISKQDHWGIVMEILPKLFAYMKQWRQYQVLSTIIQESRNQKMDQKKIFYFDRFDRKIQILCYSFSLFESKNNFLLFSSDLIKEFGEVCSENSLVNILIHLSKRNPEAFYETCKKIPKELTQKNAWILRLSKFGIDLNESQMKNEEYQNKITELIFVDSKGYLQKNIGVNEINTSIISTRMNILVRIGIAAHLPGLFSENFRNALKEFEKKQFYENFIKFSTFFNPDQFFQKLNPKYSSEIKCTEFVSPRSDWNLLGFLGKSYSPELFTLISQKNTYFAINFEQKNALPNFLLGNIPILLINGRSIRAFLSTSKISISKQIFERVFEQNIQWIINSIFYAGILSFTNKRISSTCVSYLEILGTYSTQLNIVISALNFIYKWRCSTQNTSPEEIRENLICEFTQIQYPFEISVEKIANKIEDILFSNIVVHYQKTENYNQDFFEMIGQFSAAFSREKLKDEILKQFIKKGDVIGFLRFAWKMKVDESHLFKLIESSDFQSAEHKQAFQNVSQHIFYRVYRAQNCEKDGEFFNKENQNKKKFRNYISNILAYSQKRCSAKTLMSYSMETRQPFYCVVVDILKGSKAISCMIGYFLSVVGLDFLDDLESKKKIFNRFLETPQEKLVEEIGEYLDSEEFTEEQFANVVIYLSSEFPFQLYRALVIFDSYNPLKNILKALHHFYRHQFAKMRQEINNFDINFEEMENNKQKEAKQRIFANNPDWIKQISINMIQKAVSKFSVPSTNPKILLESASKSRVFSSFFAKFFRMHEILQKFSFGNFIAVKMNEEPQFQDIFGDPYEIIRKLISMRQFRLAREFASEAGISTASVVLQEALSLMSSNKRLGRSGEKVRLKKRVLWDKCEKLFHKKKCSKKVVVEFYFSEIEKWTRSVGLNAQEYQFLVERGISRVQELNMKHNGKYRDYFDHLSSQVKIISLAKEIGHWPLPDSFFVILPNPRKKNEFENLNEKSSLNLKSLIENLNENSKENSKENLNENSNENLSENLNGNSSENLNENVNVNLNCHEIYCAYKKAFNKRAEKFKQAKNLLDSSQYSTRHQEILDLIISELLSKNNVKQAESLCQQFGYQNQEFRLIRACYQIASSEEMDSERTISNEMNSLVDILSSRKAEIPHLRSKKKAIRYLTRMVRSCKSYCQLILVTYQISKLLSISFSEVESSPYKTFRLLVNCENEDSLTFVQIFHDFYKLNDRTVAEILAEIFFNRAFSHINDPDLDETFKIRFTAFLKRFEKFVAISRNPEIIATKLLDLLKEKYAQKTKMLFNTDGEVRVLIQAHKCFRVSYSFNEIGKVEHFIQSKILVYRSKQKYDQLSLLLLNLTNPVHLEQIFDILVDDKELGSIPGQITSGETRPEVLNVLSRSLKKESKKHEEKSILSVLFHLKMHRNLGEFLLSHVRDDLSQFEPHKKRKSFDEVYRRLQEIGETCYNAAEEFEKAGCHQKMVVCFSLCSIASLQGRNLWLNLINAKIEPILINPNKSPNKDTPKSANAKKNLRPKQGAYSTRSNVNDRVNVNLNINANVNPNLTPIKKSNWNPDLQLLEIMSQKLYNFFDALIFAEYFGLGTQQAWVKSIFHQVILRQNFGYFMNYLQVFLIPNSLVAELVKTFKLQVRHKKMDARWKEGFLFVFNFIEDRAFQYQVAKELGFIDLMKKIEDSFPEIKV